jgi:hypothetical protein
MPRRPSNGNIVYGWGERWHPIRQVWMMHYAEDIGWGNGAGPDLVAPQRAQLIDYRDRGDWGMQVRLRAGNVEHRLAHTARLWDDMNVGDWLDEGQLVAVMGDTGLAAGVHVHWEVLINGVYVDPAAWLASTAGGDSLPFPTPNPEPIVWEDDMPQLITAPGRHPAVIDGGSFYQCNNSEKLQVAMQLAARRLDLSAREYDVAKGIALYAQTPTTTIKLTDAQLEAIEAAAARGGADAIRDLEFIVTVQEASA